MPDIILKREEIKEKVITKMHFRPGSSGKDWGGIWEVPGLKPSRDQKNGYLSKEKKKQPFLSPMIVRSCNFFFFLSFL